MVKSRIIRLVEDLNSDNIKITFQDTAISGFPFSWHIKFIAPKITIVGQNALQEFAFEEVIFCHNLSNTEIDFSNQITYNKTNALTNETYILSAEQNIVFNASFKDPLLFIKNNKIRSIGSSLPEISCSYQDKEIFKLQYIKTFASCEEQNALDSFKVRLSGDFISLVDSFKVHKAHLLLDMGYLVNDSVLESQSDDKDFERKIEIANLQLKLDDAAVDAKGHLKLSRSSLPKGTLDLSLIQYHDVVDILVPEGFIFSGSFIKKIISKANSLEMTKNNIGNASFRINFSDKGVTIGKLNLLELQND
ncbi:MAG: hypothetical protein Tsb006_8080 [Rickettsiaceae bacterium]